MKRKISVLLLTVALAVATVTPVFATESNMAAEVKLINAQNDTLHNALTTLVNFDNACGQNDKLSMHLIVDTANGNVNSARITEEQNYITYLKAVVGNAIETERIKKGNVDALKDLVKVNPSYQAQLDAAIADYNKAVADHAAAEAAITAAQAEFDALNASIQAAKDAKAATDADAIK